MTKETAEDDLLIAKSNAVIDSLSDLNMAQKYRVIKGLYTSLKDTIEAEGYEIKELEK